MFLRWTRRRRPSHHKICDEDTSVAMKQLASTVTTTKRRRRLADKDLTCVEASPPAPKPVVAKTESVAVRHFARGLLRVAMYNDNVSLPGSLGKREPFAHLRHCPTSDIPVSELLETLRCELNLWYIKQTSQDGVRRFASCESDSDSVATASEEESSCDAESDNEFEVREEVAVADKELSPGMRVLLLAMIYVDRLTKLANGRARLCSETMHRLLLSATQLAAQVLWNKTPKTKWFAAVGGIEKEEARELKQLFCDITGDLSVSNVQFLNCVDKCKQVMK
jgi:hypothetical protein